MSARVPDTSATAPSGPTDGVADAVGRGAAIAEVRIAMPGQLRQLARVTGEVVVEVEGPVTLQATLTALETSYPTLRGTIRDRVTGHRRPMMRIYAAGEDVSDLPSETQLPAAVLEKREPLRLVGAIAGG